MDMLIKDALHAYRAQLDREIKPNEILEDAISHFREVGTINTNDLSAALGRARTIGTIDQMLKERGE